MKLFYIFYYCRDMFVLQKANKRSICLSIDRKEMNDQREE